MKIVLILALALLMEVTAFAEPHASHAPNFSVSDLAGKFSDFHSTQPNREDDFVLGSVYVDYWKKLGIEEIKITCLDGFVKTFWIVPDTKRKVSKIDQLDRTSGVIYYSDGSQSISQFFLCPDRPVFYQVISKKVE